MKNFIADVDFTMSKRIQVEAENEEQAREILQRLIKDDPYEWSRNPDCYVSHEIVDINEE